MAKLQRETDVANVLSQMSQLVQYPHENGMINEDIALKDAMVSTSNEDSEHTYAQNLSKQVPAVQHVKAKLTKAKKKHPCELCGHVFSKLCNLKSHLLVHSGEKPHTCEFCSKAFATLWDLVKHNRTHSGEKPYKCGYCDRRFAVVGSYQRHIRLHTNEKPHKCHVCKKEFSRLDSYKNHMNTHSDKKPFVCDVCGKNFSYPSSFKRHLNSHSGERKFACDSCNKSFVRQDYLLSHRRKHEKQKRKKRKSESNETTLESVIDINEGELLLCPSTEDENSSSYSVSADLSPIPILLSMAEPAVVSGSMCNATEYLDSASLLAAASEIELGTTSTEISTPNYDVGIDLDACPIISKSQTSNIERQTRLRNDVSPDKENYATTRIPCVSPLDKSSYSAASVTDVLPLDTYSYAATNVTCVSPKPDSEHRQSNQQVDDTVTTDSLFYRQDISLLYKVGLEESLRNNESVLIEKRNSEEEEEKDEDISNGNFLEKRQDNGDDDDSCGGRETDSESTGLCESVDGNFASSLESKSFSSCIAIQESTVSYSFTF